MEKKRLEICHPTFMAKNWKMRKVIACSCHKAVIYNSNAMLWLSAGRRSRLVEAEKVRLVDIFKQTVCFTGRRFIPTGKPAMISLTVQIAISVEKCPQTGNGPVP